VLAAAVTERDRAQASAEQRLDEAQRTEVKLAEAVRAREDFLAIAGHELNTPLAALLLHEQSLQRARSSGADGERFDERLAKASAAAQRLARLVGQLLDVSRISAGRMQLEPEPVDLDGLVEQVVERVRDQAELAGSTLSVRGQSTARGSWDRMRMEQVVGNLVANAIKYGKGKPIEVATAIEDSEAVVRVTDHGIGIEREQQAKIFDRFERAVGAREFGGFGLGLWISRRIVEASGGRIGVESIPGDGATFTVRLPLAPGAQAS
jgi:signal transduction histidine kinase